MKYAGFWQRFFAGWIDFFVLLIPHVSLIWVSSVSQTLAIVCAVPHGLLYWFYTFHFHAATGQTIGKRALDIRVVCLDGSRIGRPESFRRSAVDLGFAVIWTFGSIWGVSQLSPSQLSSAGWFQQQELIDNVQPGFINWVDIASQVWVWSEVFTMLLNRQRRAIHDFIAGTIVVNESAS